MLVFAWAIESKRSPSSGGVRKIPGHPGKAEAQAESLKLILSICPTSGFCGSADSICKQKFKKLKIAWATLEP